MPSPSSPISQFVRVAGTARRRLTLAVDGVAVTAFAGDTVLTALLCAGHRLRGAEPRAGPRAGFCLMGACQDCWVGLGDGRRVRACTTLVSDGMEIATGWGETT